MIGEGFGRQLPIIVPTNQAHLGMAASIADGIRAVVDWDYAFLGLGDMPYIRPDTLRTLKAAMDDAFASTKSRASCVPMHGDTPGHPVGFSREFFAELIALTGDRGARSVVDAHRAAVQTHRHRRSRHRDRHRPSADVAGSIRPADGYSGLTGPPRRDAQSSLLRHAS